MRLVHLLGCMSTPFEWHCAHHACTQILCIAFTHSSLLTLTTISPSFFLWLIVFTFSLNSVVSSIRTYVNPIRMALCSSCMHSHIMYCHHTLLTLTTISPSFLLWLIVFTFSLHEVGSSISLYVNPNRMALCSSCMRSNIMYCLHTLPTLTTISPSFFLWLIVFTLSHHAVGSSIRVYVNPIRMALCSSCMRSNIMYCLHTLLSLTTISPSFFVWPIMFTFSLHAVGSSIRMYVNPIRMALCSSCMHSNIMYCLHTLLTLTTISPSFFLWLIVFTSSLHAVGSSISLYVNPIRMALCSSCMCSNIMYCLHTILTPHNQNNLTFFLLVADHVHFLSPCGWFIY